MSILDDADRWLSADPRSMRELLESFPVHVKKAAQEGSRITLHKPTGIRVLIVTGLGGSAIGGDLARAIAGPHLKIPMIINRDYDMPGFMDASAMVIACSYSGNTEETLSAYRQARDAKANILCITSGGKLAAMGNADTIPVLSLPPGFPPRAALGYSLLTLLSALQALNIIPDISGAVEEALELLETLRGLYGTENPENGNRAKSMARSLSGKVVAVYGSSAITESVAYRWRSQIAENSKNLAFHHVLPEMNHNELVGWEYPEEVLKQIGVVLLRDKGDHPQVQRRFELTREIIAGRAGAVHEIWSEGNSLLARVLSMLYLGDFVSLYLACLNNVDPTPVQVIDSFKSKLSSLT